MKENLKKEASDQGRKHIIKEKERKKERRKNTSWKNQRKEG